MKLLPSIALLLIVQCCFGQNKSGETKVPCVAYWKKGEQKTYLITRKKEKLSNGQSSVTENFQIETTMTILDSTAEGYTITWEYGIPPELDKNSMMYKVAEIMEKMEFVYKTDDVGIFTELVNWEQIRDFYLGMFKLQLQDRKPDEKNQKVLDELLATFQKREVIESMAIKEIQLLHAPYGLIFSTKDTSVSTHLSIPIITEEPMPAIQCWGIAETGKDNDNFKLLITQSVDSAGLRVLLESIFKKYSPEQNIEKEKLSKELASFKFDDIAEYSFIQSTGWIREYVCTRKGGAGNQVQIETYKMELRER